LAAAESAQFAAQTTPAARAHWAVPQLTLMPSASGEVTI